MTEQEIEDCAMALAAEAGFEWLNTETSARKAFRFCAKEIAELKAHEKELSTELDSLEEEASRFDTDYQKIVDQLAEATSKNSEQSDILREMDKACTPGHWGQFATGSGPWQKEAMDAYRAKNLAALDTSHSVSTLYDGKPYRIGTFTHAADAAFAESLVNAYRAGNLKHVGDTDAN